jgi:undecaprenyl-phosphate 4-deoxy-4-formamido-L-arabinose transferase
MGNRSLSIVVPLLNEADNLGPLIRRLLATCLSTARPFEIVFVDDGSEDASAEMLRAAVQEHPSQIVAVFLDRNYGQHTALFAGFRRAVGDVIVTIDADLQNPPEEIPRLVDKIEEGYDVVGTIRSLRRDPLFRRLASGAMNCISSVASGVVMRDYGCMLRAYRRSVVEAMLSRARKRAFIPVLANCFAKNCCEIRVDHAPRHSGESRYNLWRLLRLQLNLLMGRPLRTDAPPGTQAGPPYLVKEVVGESGLYLRSENR